MSNPRRSGWLHNTRRALGFVRPYRSTTAVILILALVGAALSALEPLLLKQLFDGVARPSAGSLILICIGALLTIELAREGVNACNNYLGWKVRLAVHFAVLEATVGRLHTLPVSFHREQGVGSTMTRLDRGISGFVGALSEITTNVLPAFAYLGISLWVMLRLDWRLSLVVLVFTPLPAVFASFFADEQSRRERTLLDRWSRIYGRFNEVLSGIVTVKSYTMEDEEKRRFLRDVNEANEVVVRGVGRDSRTGIVRNLAGIAARLSALGVGGYLVQRGELTLGGLVAFIGYVGGLFGPVQGLTNVYQTLRKAAVSLETIFSILDAQDSLGDATDALSLPAVRGTVEFQNVSFDYGNGRPVLEDINLRASKGEVVALIGASGGGKSTLMALLQRLYDPSSGRVLLDDVDIRSVKQRELRSHIGVVLQDALLFDDTVGNNIAYGRAAATQAEIERAARAAHAHDFIQRLPGGYNALVGERGSRLSMGERQRIAIARALLKDPPILILDEATSALDAESEALVQDALATLMVGRTTFVIAHRLATIANAHRICVLRNGRITDVGTHDELIKTSAYYASLVAAQTRGLIRVVA